MPSYAVKNKSVFNYDAPFLTMCCNTSYMDQRWQFDRKASSSFSSSITLAQSSSSSPVGPNVDVQFGCTKPDEPDDVSNSVHPVPTGRSAIGSAIRGFMLTRAHHTHIAHSASQKLTVLQKVHRDGHYDCGTENGAPNATNPVDRCLVVAEVREGWSRKKNHHHQHHHDRNRTAHTT